MGNLKPGATYIYESPDGANIPDVSILNGFWILGEVRDPQVTDFN